MAHGLLQRLGAGGRDGRTEDLAERAVRAAGHLEAAPAENEPSLCGGFAGDLGGEPRRADAGCARHEDHRSVACRRAVERHPDVQPFLLAVDESVTGGEHPRRFLHLAGRDLVQPPAVGESLQLVASAKLELHLVDRADELAHDIGDENLATLRFARHPRGDVDGRAKDVAGLLDHLAGVEADADPKLSLRILLAVLRDRALDVDRALHAMARGAEADHEAVAESLDPPPGVLADLLVDYGLVRFHDLVRGREASRREQPRRLLDVGEHDGHGAFGLTDRETADDGLGGKRRGRVDGLSETLGDLAQEAL